MDRVLVSSTKALAFSINEPNPTESEKLLLKIWKRGEFGRASLKQKRMKVQIAKLKKIRNKKNMRRQKKSPQF